MKEPKNLNQDPQASGGILPSDAERQLRQDASAIADTAKSEFANVKAEAEEGIGALAEQGQAEIAKVIDKAKGMATEQKDLLATQLSGISSAVTKVANELEAEDATTAGYARTVADGVDRFTRTLKERGVDDLVAMAEDFGRKQPGAFMAAAAIAGFAASRFLVASANRQSSKSQVSVRPTGTDTGYADSSPVSGGTLGNRQNFGGTV